jgi:uncharacterized phosphosugar-binding protein
MNKWSQFDGIIKRLLRDIHIHLNTNLTRACELIKEPIDPDRRNSLMWGLGIDYALYAELFKRKGNQSKARENLNKAIDILKE